VKIVHFIKDRLNSLSHAINGIKYVFATQKNMQIHLFVSVVALFLCAILKVSIVEVLFVLFAIVFVMVMELINTAIERTVDLITSGFHPLAKIAKDVAAGAVLFAAIFAFIVGLYVFVDPIMKLIKGF
jgi:diacylglycerol kinase